MAKEFKEDSIPYSHGHTFEVLFSAFQPKCNDFKDLDIENTWTQLNDLLKNAKDTDKIYARQMYPNQTDKENLINNLGRAAGILRGWKGIM